MDWIDIKDGLPDIAERYDEAMEKNIMASEPVLVSKDGNRVMFGYFEKTLAGVIFVNVLEAYDVFGDGEYELDEISHWMPLPAPAEISNEEWFKRALVEGLNRRFQREIDNCDKQQNAKSVEVVYVVLFTLRSNSISYNGTPAYILARGATACHYIDSGFYRMA